MQTVAIFFLLLFSSKTKRSSGFNYMNRNNSRYFLLKVNKHTSYIEIEVNLETIIKIFSHFKKGNNRIIKALFFFFDMPFSFV